MATVGKPDLAEYRTRLAQIVPTIGITLPDGWTASDVNVFKVPGLGQAAYPFWVISRPTITSNRITAREYRWRMSWIFFLARSGDSSTSKLTDLADQVDDDVADVMEFFQSRHEFVSSTLTTNQAGYLPGSFDIVANADSSYPVKTGVVLGSAYTLTLLHRVIYDYRYQ